MKINELKDRWNHSYAIGHKPILIAHNNNKTVTFWPIGFAEDKDHYILNGWWYCNQIDDLLVQEEIKIKKEDLINWSIC